MTLMTLFLLQGQPAGGGSMLWIMLIAMFVIMYFFMIRPQNKKQKEIANFRKSLQVNQKVVTAGGIHGIIKEIIDRLGFANKEVVSINTQQLYRNIGIDLQETPELKF